MSALALTALKDGDVGIVLVCEEDLEAVPIVVGERQLRTGVRALAPNDQPGALRPTVQVDEVGDLGGLPVRAFPTVPVKRWDPNGFQAGRGSHCEQPAHIRST